MASYESKDHQMHKLPKAFAVDFLKSRYALDCEGSQFGIVKLFFI
jgi:hypothetical protein